MKLKLKEDWRKAPKWLSVQAMGVAAAIQGTWAVIPPEMQQSIPHDVVSYGTMAIVGLGVLGRVLEQS